MASLSPALQALVNQASYPAQYAAYDTQFPGSKEVIGWSWYDTLTYTSAVTNTLTFFTQINAKTLAQTNMTIAGQLAAPQAFFLRAIRIKPIIPPFSSAIAAPPANQAGALSDMLNLITQGVAQLTVGQKIYGQWPIWELPGGGGLFSNITGSAADTMQYASNGIVDPRAVYSLTQPLFFAPQINWKLDLLWPGGPVTLTTGTPNIVVIFDGDLIRPVQ
jgi:hypothetical protein